MEMTGVGDWLKSQRGAGGCGGFGTLFIFGGSCRRFGVKFRKNFVPEACG